MPFSDVRGCKIQFHLYGVDVALRLLCSLYIPINLPLPARV